MMEFVFYHCSHHVFENNIKLWTIVRSDEVFLLQISIVTIALHQLQQIKNYFWSKISPNFPKVFSECWVGSEVTIKIQRLSGLSFSPPLEIQFWDQGSPGKISPLRDVFFAMSEKISAQKVPMSTALTRLSWLLVVVCTSITPRMLIIVLM